MAPKLDRLALIFGIVAKLFAKATTKLGLATTIAALWLTAVSPVMAQKYSSGEVETSRHDSLLPPRVDRVDVRASLLYWGMPGVDVERIMGTSAELQTYDGPGGNVRVLSYPTEPIATIVSICNGQVSGVRLDIAGIDERTLPAYSRPAWLGMDRTTVLRILGVPADDQLHDSFDMKLEHMIFAARGSPTSASSLSEGALRASEPGETFRRASSVSRCLCRLKRRTGRPMPKVSRAARDRYGLA